MNRRLITIAVLVAAAAAGSWLLWRSQHPVGNTHTLRLYGNIDIREVNLAFNGNQRIARLLVDEGQQVHKGQVLGELDTRYLTADVEQARAQLAAQQQVLAALRAGSRPQEIRQLRANVDAAKVDLTNARSSYRRLRDLAQRNLASVQQRDDARTAMDTAQARLEAVQQTLSLAVEGPRKEDIAAAADTLKAREAALDLARHALSDAVLAAPADGIIRDRILEPGDMASPQQPVYTLALTDRIWVRAYVSETDLGRIRPGMAATVTTDSDPGRRYHGTIGYISPTAEFTPKSIETPEVRTTLVYQLRVYVRDADNQLRLGMPATVHIDLDRGADDGAHATGG
ncbi:MAG: efflux RND transporter periplasmic adaptor subunit [Gammaproteobacteria bacterium]|nr:efflux RND transporter periplasmic adaptor subunit [Gammaproteobacteria bacterium]